ncbi:25503_t:CDS:2, partial [Gigaspora rosea]
ESEIQDHLAKYEIYRDLWKKIEYEIKEEVLFREDEYEKIRKQKLIIQGLVPASLEKETVEEK